MFHGLSAPNKSGALPSDRHHTMTLVNPSPSPALEKKWSRVLLHHVTWCVSRLHCSNFAFVREQ